MCEMTCAVMGCRSTKPKNSVADESGDNITNGKNINYANDNNRNHESQVTNGDKPQVNTTESIKMNKRPILTVPTSKDLPCTQSQLDFFEMLDKKIDSGRDYNSKEDISKLRR